MDLGQLGPGQHLVGQLSRGEPVRAQHECSARLAGSRSHGLIHVGQAERAGSLIPLLIGVSNAGVEPLSEHAGVHLQEDVQDLLPRVGQAAEDLGPVGVADQRHRDDERFRVVPAQRQRRRDDQFPPARQVLEVAVGPHPLPEHEADVFRVIYDRARELPVQFLRERRLARAEPAVDPDNHPHKLPASASARLVKLGNA
jgi:hypothetical protein